MVDRAVTGCRSGDADRPVTSRGSLRFIVPAVLAVVTVSIALYPMMRERARDAAAVEECEERLVPAAAADRAPRVSGPPDHVGVVAASADGRRTCVDVTVGFRAPRQMSRLDLLVPTFPGAVAIDEVEVSGREVGDLPDRARAGVVRVPIDPPLAQGEAARVRLRTVIRVPRDVDRSGALQGELPTVDLAPPQPPRERRARAVPGGWAVAVHADDVVVTGGVDSECEPGPAARCVVSVADGVSSLAVVTLPPGVRRDEGRDIAGMRLRSHGLSPAVEAAAFDAVEHLVDLLGEPPGGEIDLVASPATGEPVPGVVRLGGDCPGQRLGPLPGRECLHWGVGRVVAGQWFGATVRLIEARHRVAVVSIAEYLATVNAIRAGLTEDEARDHIEEIISGGRRAIVGMVPASPPREDLAPPIEAALMRGWAVGGWLDAEARAGRERVIALLTELFDDRAGGDLRPVHVTDVAAARYPVVREALVRSWEERIPRSDAEREPGPEG